MSWASRRRTEYIAGVLLFFLVVVGLPLAYFLYQPPTCFDRKQNQGETSVDKGGPCEILDSNALIASSVLWSRAFAARDGSYSAVAYIENPNKSAGVRRVSYHFGLYDERNVLVADREGTTAILPGVITPVFEGGISTGNRAVAHTYFQFTEAPVWERLHNTGAALTLSNVSTDDTATMPRLSASVHNTSVANISNPEFVAVVFDPAGNAFAASATTLTSIRGGETQDLRFTWPDPFPSAVGQVDILPVVPPSR